MIQVEVFELLRKEGPLTREEISTRIGISANNAGRNLMRLRKRREIEVICLKSGKYRYTLKEDSNESRRPLLSLGCAKKRWD